MRSLSWGSALNRVLTSNCIVLHSCRCYSLSSTEFKFALSLVHPTPEVSEYFPSARKLRADVFQFRRFEEHFRKAEFSRRIGVDDRPKRRKNLAFSNFCCVMWRKPWRFTKTSGWAFCPAICLFNINQFDQIQWKGVQQSHIFSC